MNTTVTLLPRMSALDVQQIVEAIDPSAGPTFGLDAAAQVPESVTYAPVGGTPASPGQLAEVRRRIEHVARQFGYPKPGTAEGRARFDAECAPVLADLPILDSGEALRDDVWAFLATCLLSPVTYWRYGASPDRWHGGVRNTFQRLWIRARALDRGPAHEQRWGLLDALSEDALVAITERTVIAAQRPLAVAVGEGWIRAAGVYGRNRMEPIMRRAVIAVRLKNEVTALDTLDDAALAAIVDQAFRRAAETLGVEPLQEPGSGRPDSSAGRSAGGWLRRRFGGGSAAREEV